MSADLATIVMQRIDALAQISEDEGKLTRTFASPAMRRANDLVAGWMREAGLSVREDAIGNLIGRYEADRADAKTFLLGSHLDTVRDAGKFDGPLGVLIAIACVHRLHDANVRLPFAIEVVGFCDEEGVRYQSAYLGSKAMAGTFNVADLKRLDADGVPMAEAIRNFGGNPDAIQSARLAPEHFLGYAEVHIEQGPVLERKSCPVGIVTAIAGQSRIKVRFIGQAAHAGTTPMALRRDALLAAAQFIVWVEAATKNYPELVATVGQIEVQPGASNVIPGEVNLSLDVRHHVDTTRTAACDHFHSIARGIGEQSGIGVDWMIVQQITSVPCSRELSDVLKRAIRQHLDEVIELPSGAGHDAAALAAIMPVAMLFVRCKEGISHHPDESAQMDDVEVAIAVMNDFLAFLAKQPAGLTVSLDAPA